ncbi:MAG: FHA domain-containing protein [Trichodesmium sp. ALOHA_ZT_67]|nr:FHA domain-containing protein [Trichodesmium sp. ALOHA_ZT_67]MDE5093128.1 FHA domain-containing protein [Trichodesmium sp. St11_bin5]
MIVCPNCNHQNPDGANQCESCYTPLPVTTNCYNCGAIVQADAAFCGQCGVDLKGSANTEEGQILSQTDPIPVPTAVSAMPEPDTNIPINIPQLDLPEPLVAPEPLLSGTVNLEKSSNPKTPIPIQKEEPPTTTNTVSTPVATPIVSSPAPNGGKAIPVRTQLQNMSAKLLHVRTDTNIELPINLSVIHVGKPNDKVPPDIDVSGFPDSEVVSRSHADIRVEGDSYYIEDTGSSNGTYINNTPLTKGNRHKLRPGDRISLGKGDLVSFLFQIS